MLDESFDDSGASDGARIIWSVRAVADEVIE
jgi:hypothetical protein